MEIKLTQRLDRSIIDAAITLPVTIIQEYSNALNESEVSDLIAQTSDIIDAFKIVTDFASNLFEADATIWNIEESSKTFYLAKSYVRDTEDTTTVTDVAAGTPLIVQFETPSFTVFNVTELSLWYDQPFDPGEIAALSAIGIDVTGNGTTFTIDNAIECKVHFKKPDIITDVYVINNGALNQVIPI